MAGVEIAGLRPLGSKPCIVSMRVPAQPGTHLSAASKAAQLVVAFAGTTFGSTAVISIKRSSERRQIEGHVFQSEIRSGSNLPVPGLVPGTHVFVARLSPWFR